MATPLPITTGYYESRSLPISHQQCVNWYPSRVLDGQVPECMFGTPGLMQIATTGEVQQQNRGAHVKNGIPYFVNGTTLYSLTRSYDITGAEVFTTNILGTIESTGRVSMCDNGTQLMILVPNGKGYIYNENAGTPFQQITDADFVANGSPQYAVFCDGYFVVTTDSKKWIISNLNDGLSWNALDFASAESDPDAIVAPAVVKNQVFLTGSETTEGYQNIGGFGFPFQRSNLFIDKGCYAPFSIVTANNTFYMIGGGTNEDPAIWMYQSASFVKISTDAIDKILSDYTDSELKGAWGWTYSQDGNIFIGWSLFDRTIVFDFTTGKWHERNSRVIETQDNWRVASFVKAYGRLLVGDVHDGRIGEVKTDLYTEYDGAVVRTIATRPFTKEGRPFTVPFLELTMESGVGTATVENPQVGLAISRDGKIFNYDRNRSIGKKGRYEHRIIWRRNGVFDRWCVLRFTLSDPVKPVIIKLEAE